MNKLDWWIGQIDDYLRTRRWYKAFNRWANRVLG